jgi:hypothetical protein
LRRTALLRSPPPVPMIRAWSRNCSIPGCG